MTRWISRSIWFAVLAAVLGGVVYAFLPRPVAVDLAAVCRGPLAVTVDEDGKTRVRDRYIVSSPLNGKMRRVVLKPGDTVRQGETILTSIEPTDPSLLDPRELVQSELRVKRAEALLRQAGPQTLRAHEALLMSQSDLKRVRELRAKGAKSQEDLEIAIHTERMRSEEHNSVRIAEDIARSELDLAKAAFVRTRDGPGSTGDEWRLDIRAPISGRVFRVFKESASVVTPGSPIVELGDPADLEVEIDVLSTDAVKVRPGARVLLEQWGGQKPLEARVRLVEPSGFTKTSALGVEEQRVNVIADIVAPRAERGRLGDAFRIEARIVVWEDASVLKVPTAALFRRGEAWAAFLVREGRAVLQPLKVGHTNGLETEVLDGLREGDLVVLHPGDRVHEGSALTRRP